MKLNGFFAKFLVILLFTSSARAALNLPEIKLELVKLEGSKDKQLGIAKCEELLAKINTEVEDDKNSAELSTWRGIVVAKMAHYYAPKPKALSLAKEARSYLEKAIKIDEATSDAAALNALGILYHRVPKFISFGDNQKSEEYFKRAVHVSSNLDTNWRYGEFLIENGRNEEGLAMLRLALSKADRKKSDEKIKEGIIQSLIKKHESR